MRLYRDTLTADMKTAIKNAVAELLPVLVSRPLELELGTGERTVDADGEKYVIHYLIRGVYVLLSKLSNSFLSWDLFHFAVIFLFRLL